MKLRLKAAGKDLLDAAGNAAETAARLSRLRGEVAAPTVRPPTRSFEQANAQRRLGGLDPVPRGAVGNIKLFGGSS